MPIPLAPYVSTCSSGLKNVVGMRTLILAGTATQVNNPDSTPTPHFGELARAGIVLKRHHSFKYCSPTRRSFMSGRFPTLISEEQAAVCSNLLPLEFTLISEKLERANYEGHFIGKGTLFTLTIATFALFLSTVFYHCQNSSLSSCLVHQVTSATKQWTTSQSIVGS